MNNNSRHNAITQRLELLQSNYSDFHNHPKAKVCIWLLEADEYSMLEQFLKMESSVAASSPDLFVKFYASFRRPSNYSKSLVKELNMLVEGYRNNEKTTGVQIKWRPLRAPAEFQNTPVEFTHNFSAFAKGLEDLEYSAVAYLNPAEVRDFKKMENWIAQAIKSGIQDNVRLMIVDFVENQQFKKLPVQFPELVMTIQPKLQMTQAMKELALAGGSNNSGTQFQLLYIELSKAASKGEMEKVEKYADRAMEIAVSEGWLHLQVAVYQIVATAWLEKKDLEKSMQSFDNAIKIAKTAVRQEDPIGRKILANALFGKAAILVNQKDYEAAGEIYESIIPVTQEEKDHYLTMEAFRMVAFCFEKKRKYDLAFSNYQNAIAAGENLDAEIQPNTTIADSGKALLRINDDHFNDNKKEDWINRKMTELLGENWQSLTLENQM